MAVNAGTLARARTLTIDLGPGARDALAGAVTTFTTDVRLARALGVTARFGSWIDAEHELAIVHMPKERERLAMLLGMARGAAPEVALVGHNRAGIRSADKVLRAHVGTARVLDTRAHCRLLLARGDAAAPTRGLESWRISFEAAGLKIASYPGVFSHGELDPGTSMLLEALPDPAGARALDVGCGAGIITAWLAARGAHVTAVDVDALALTATAETLRANEVVASVLASDVYDQVEGEFDLIVSNPPFHRGVRTTSVVASRLIAEAPLARGGELWLVSNRFLDHPEQIRARFRHVDEVAGDARYRVLRAR